MEVRVRQFSAFLILCLFSLAAIYPLFSVPTWYDNHEGDSYLFRMLEFKGIFSSGMWYPRWASRLLGGYGYPAFVFYQPGVFFFLLPFLYLPLSLPMQFTVGIYCIFLLSALGCYRLARMSGMERFIAALAASIYLFMPYAYANLYIRGDLSEFFAMMLCPWVMVGIFRLKQEAAEPVRWSSLSLYVVSLAAVFFSHPYVALFMILIIGWFVTVELRYDGLKSRLAWLLVTGGLMATVLSAPYWLTVFQLGSSVALSVVKHLMDESMTFSELFYRTDADYYPWEISRVGVVSPFYLALGIIGFILTYPKRLFWLMMPPLLLSIFMVTKTTLPLWHMIPGSDFIQFAWRILSISGLLQYIGILQLGRLGGKLKLGDYYVAAAFLVLVGMTFQPSIGSNAKTGGFALQLFEYNRYFMRLNPIASTDFLKPFKSQESVFAVDNAFGPIWADNDGLLQPPQNSDSPVFAPKNIAVQVDESVLPYRIKVGIDVDAHNYPIAPSSVEELPSITLHQIYFPGWVGMVNGHRIKFQDIADHDWRNRPSAHKDKFGRIQIAFTSAGHYEIVSYYEGPPYWLLRNFIMVLLMGGLVYGCVRYRLAPPLPVLSLG